jgi:peptide/histidine transporter 3/4
MENIAADPVADTPLLPGRRGHRWLAMRYRSTRKCVGSKAALLILLWSFTVGLLSGVLLNSDLSIPFTPAWTFTGLIALINCFLPLAGFLADVHFGRYKTVTRSLCLIILSVLTLAVAVGLIVLSVFLIKVHTRAFICIMTILVTLGALGLILVYTGLVGFTANIVQFGMDQLHDSPGEDRTIFIHWYVWTYYASVLVVQLAWSLIFLQYPRFNIYMTIGCGWMAFTILAVVVVLSTTLCLARRRRRYFLIEPGQYNPYKLVYRVTKFACRHKIPVHRSAFTYCEDEVPRGLDLGKGKYGGPFTTEQVEDVKTFYGILKVLLIFGVAFLIEFAANISLTYFVAHTAPNWDSNTTSIHTSTVFIVVLIYYRQLSPLLIVISIPLYLCLLRPFISQHVPGMLKRMGLGMSLAVLSLMITFSMDTVAHVEADTNFCMFSKIMQHWFEIQRQNLNPAFVTIQLTLSALSRMLIYTGVFEFICSQSPHSMKGLLIGVLYVVRGLYQVIAVLTTLPYTLVGGDMHPSCGFYYYLMNIVIGLVAMLVYMCVAKRYRYRVRDELCNVYQYAEEYYSNQQREEGYDYYHRD